MPGRARPRHRRAAHRHRGPRAALGGSRRPRRHPGRRGQRPRRLLETTAALISIPARLPHQAAPREARLCSYSLSAGGFGEERLARGAGASMAPPPPRRTRASRWCPAVAEERPVHRGDHRAPVLVVRHAEWPWSRRHAAPGSPPKSALTGPSSASSHISTARRRMAPPRLSANGRFEGWRIHVRGQEPLARAAAAPPGPPSTTEPAFELMFDPVSRDHLW